MSYMADARGGLADGLDCCKLATAPSAVHMRTHESRGHPMATNEAPTKRRRNTQMSDVHKAALAEGREQSQVIRRYLEAILAQPARMGAIWSSSSSNPDCGCVRRTRRRRPLRPG